MVIGHQHSTHGTDEEEAVRLWLERPIKVVSPSRLPSPSSRRHWSRVVQLCSVEGCDRPVRVKARGLCMACYKR